MSVWVEIHCDKHSAGIRPAGLKEQPCLSDIGGGVGMLARNSGEGVKTAYAKMYELAREQGWQHNGKFMICPACQTRMG